MNVRAEICQWQIGEMLSRLPVLMSGGGEQSEAISSRLNKIRAIKGTINLYRLKILNPSIVFIYQKINNI